MRVSIVTPTRRRPQSLARALNSLAGQDFEAAHVELIVADNDEAAGARDLVEAFSKTAPFPVRYVHEPVPGVANVRNAAMRAANGLFVAFLDDDEEAPSGWLSALMTAQAAFDADVVFGPVRGVAPEGLGWRRDYLARFFSREGPAEAGLIEAPYGCGNSLVRRAAMPSPEPFARTQNHIGGEDDLLFMAMRKARARFAWAPDAWVWEHPEDDRLTLRYALKRAFAFGQGPPHAAFRKSPPDVAGVVGWMGVGVVQAVVHGAAAGVKWASRAPDRADALDRAARGLGKVLWFPPFKPRFYGLPAARPGPVAASGRTAAVQ